MLISDKLEPAGKVLPELRYDISIRCQFLRWTCYISVMMLSNYDKLVLHIYKYSSELRQSDPSKMIHNLWISFKYFTSRPDMNLWPSPRSEQIYTMS